MMRGMSEAHYDERSIVTSSDMEGSVVGAHGGAGNVYDVEHLATFQLSKDLAFPADGMRRLLHMEKNGFGIWSQKMRIRLEHRDIVILDYENGDEMERFPLQLIRDPTAFTNTNPGELYNNIFAFTVHPVEMHIFQCFNISAADLVEDVKLALQGRAPPNRQRHSSQQSLPPPPVQPPPEPPHFHVTPPKDDGRDDGSSVESEGGYEREVAILNRCFDDIERFIARLQFAAAAYRELQRRRKSKKGKKKDHGEGLLSMRARPPHEREFVDILQKFKLSFNLLARLKTHIHDPNAPELVHFLFTPLALIVDASRDAHAAGLATRVVAPLLSRGAIELLNNCLTSKETELWHSLGDAWLLPREQWKGYVPQYQPVFMDGWSPTIPDSNNLGAAVASEAQRRMQERIIQAAQHEADARRVERERSISPVEIMPDDFASGQRAFVDSIRGRGGRVVMVTHPRTANNHKELTVVRGEYLEVLDDSKKWWKACNWKGQVAHVPHTIVSLLSEYPQEAGAYHGDRSDNWSSPSTSISSEDEMFARKGSPPPPPPPAPPQPGVSRSSSGSPADLHSPKKKDKKRLEDELMQMELKNVLTIYREKRHIAIPRTPEVYINQNSTPTEVQEWLKVKGFSTRIQKQLAGMNGGELFKLNRSSIEEYCDKEEGRRLDSQITISRNTSGYKTARSSELRAILARARAKAEQPNGSFDSTPVASSSADKGLSGSGSEGSSKSPSPEKTSAKSSAARSKVRSQNLKTTFKEESKAYKSRYDEDSDDDIVTKHFNFSDDGDDDSDDDANKGTLGRMLKQKRREMLQRK